MRALTGTEQRYLVEALGGRVGEPVDLIACETPAPKPKAKRTTALIASGPKGPIAVRAADIRLRMLPPPPRRSILGAANFLT
jgi:hypothetical protein